MKKKLLARGLLGFPVGISISVVITVIISVIIGTGEFYPVTPGLIAAAGNELHAVIAQTLLSGLMGTGFAMASLIWDIDEWSLAKQSGIYFAAASVLMLPVAYITNWMHHSVAGVLSYVGIFIGIFVLVWILQYLVLRYKIRKMNDGVHGQEHPEKNPSDD